MCSEISRYGSKAGGARSYGVLNVVCKALVLCGSENLLKETRKAVRKLHAAEFGSNVMSVEKKRVVCGSSEIIKTMALWVPVQKKVYLAVLEEYDLQKVTRPLEAV